MKEYKNMTFDEIKSAYDEHEEQTNLDIDWVKEGNAIENAFEIEETQCLCWCCKHSGKCPMEEEHNTTYGTFVTACKYYEEQT